MGSISLSNSLPKTRLPLLLHHSIVNPFFPFLLLPLSNRRRHPQSPVSAGVNNSASARNGGYTIGDFMTPRQNLHVVKPSTSVDDALELLVEKKVTGLPVIDDDWNLYLEIAITVEIATGKGLLENFGVASPLPTVALAVTALVGVLAAVFIFQSSKN